MFKPSPYGELQTLFKEERRLTPKERLAAAREPLLFWYRKNRRNLPWRENRDAYRIWISEIMLQQTRVEAVKPYFARFMEHFPTIGKLADASEDELLKCWEGLGYYSRARNLQKAAKVIVSEYGGILPPSRDALLSLPGIGSYTAGAIASIAYEIPVPAVDGNVLRVLSRVTESRDDILKQTTKRKMEELVMDILSEGDAGDLNQALIETGAMVCVPGGEPLCGQCPFFTVCAAREKGLISELPVKTPKKKRKIEEKTVLLIEYRDRIAIRKRSEEGLLASLYEFPNVSGRLSEDQVRSLVGTSTDIRELKEAKHIFSHMEWSMAGYFISLSGPPADLQKAGIEDVIFVEKEELKNRYPIPSAFAAFKKFLEEQHGG